MPIFDDDDFDCSGSNKSKKSKINEEIDPLDAYMATIDQELKAEQKIASKLSKNTPKAKQSAIRDDIEQLDAHEEYLKMVNDDPAIGFELKADEFIDFEVDKNGNSIRVKKKIEPLKQIDHSKIDYKPFKKNFYNAHPQIEDLPSGDVEKMRFELNITVSGNDSIAPVTSFAFFDLDEQILDRIRKSNFLTPTPIQAQALPIIFSGKNLIAIAETGSGKTAAFVWPMIPIIMNKNKDITKIEESENDNGKPLILVLSPTRELCAQIKSNIDKFCPKPIKSLTLCGGESIWQQQQSCSQKIDIIVGTPGRIIDLVKKGCVFLHRIQYLVIDEADKMFSMGFEEQVKSISKNIRPDRQTVLFSATASQRLARLARSVIHGSYVKVMQGKSGHANQNVKQCFFYCKDAYDKLNWTIHNLTKYFALGGSILIFANQKDVAASLAVNLNKQGYQTQAIHGDLGQHSRNDIISDFRKQIFRVLIATDVASRGLDIPEIQTVINFDLPQKFDTYVHRIGRTGRAGKTGESISLVTHQDDPNTVKKIINQCENFDEIPQEIINLSSKAKTEGNNKYGKKAFGLGSSMSKSRNETLHDLKNSSKFSAGSERAKILKESLKNSFKSSFVSANENLQITSEKPTQQTNSRWD